MEFYYFLFYECKGVSITCKWTSVKTVPLSFVRLSHMVPVTFFHYFGVDIQLYEHITFTLLLTTHFSIRFSLIFFSGTVPILSETVTQDPYNQYKRQPYLGVNRQWKFTSVPLDYYHDFKYSYALCQKGWGQCTFDNFNNWEEHIS